MTSTSEQETPNPGKLSLASRRLKLGHRTVATALLFLFSIYAAAFAQRDPRFAQHKPAEFIASGPLAELDRSGYIDRLYATK